MTDLRAQLQTTLGAAYTLERELGGGGMSRVFLAQEIGSALDHRADLYAWGVVAYELLAGAHPFAGKSGPQQLIAAHIAEVPAPLTVRAPGVPPLIADLVLRCLAKDPGHRPSSAADLLAGLEAAATPVPWAPARPASARRRLTIAAATVAGLLLAGLGVRAIARRAPATPSGGPGTERSLAVLPFESVGGDTANSYFAEGIADELSTAFARIPGLRLAGRSAAARFRDRSATEIGTALNVGAILDGRVRRAGDRIRVSAELTSGMDGRVLWTETYERELKDVFAVQDDITRAIVAALQVQLGAGDASGAGSRQGTSDLAAYDLYLRGLQLYRKRGPGLAQAEQYLQQAIGRDSVFARAYATLALVLLVQPYFLDRHMGEVLPRARAAAERAVALDDALPEAHLAMGHLHTEAFEWLEAEAELRRALALDPSRPDALYRLGFMLMTSGRVQEAIPPLERAKAVDPYYPTPMAYLGWALALTGRADEGVADGRRAVDLDTTNESSRNVMSRTYAAAGRWAEAGESSRLALRTTSNVGRMGFYAGVLAASGARSEAEGIVRRLEALSPSTWGRDRALAYSYLGLGDTARALTRMEHAAAGDGDLLLAMVPSDPFYDQLRSSPRFAAVLKRFNLDPARIERAPRAPHP